MPIYCRGTARIRHNKTGDIHQIECKELDWDAVVDDERQMGTEVQYETMTEHPELGKVTWSFWEYPMGFVSHRSTDAGEHEIVEDFDYGLAPEALEFDDWLNYEAPGNPYTIFSDSYHHTGDLLADHGGPYGGYLLNRMVFSHQITAMEAYLGDTLINAVMEDLGALTRLIVTAKELVDARFTLAQIANSPDLVKKTVRAYLRDVQYHNLAKVDMLYKSAFGFQILNLSNDESSLFKAVSLRHDCVHRNGFDKDGNELTVFTKEFVQETADQIRGFVDNIEKAVRGGQKNAL